MKINTIKKIFSVVLYFQAGVFVALLFLYFGSEITHNFRLTRSIVDRSQGDLNKISKIDYYYSKDNYNVYFKDVLVKGADPDTFEILSKTSYATDKKNCYFEGKKISGIDTKSIHSINKKEIDDNKETIAYDYIADSKHIYFKGEQVLGDPETYLVLRDGNNPIAKDKNNIYFKNTIVQDADPDTYEPIGNITGIGILYISNDRAFLNDDLLENISTKDLKILNTMNSKYGRKFENIDGIYHIDYSRENRQPVIFENKDWNKPDSYFFLPDDLDNNDIAQTTEHYVIYDDQVYYTRSYISKTIVNPNLYKIPEADAKSLLIFQVDLWDRLFTDTSDYYDSAIAVDNKHLYFQGKVVEGIDGASFDIPKIDANSYDYLSSYQGFYFTDKNGVYFFRRLGIESASYWVEKVVDADKDSFQVLSKNALAKDKNHVYYESTVIEGANPESYKVIGPDGLAQDGSKLFYYNYYVPGVVLDDSYDYKNISKNSIPNYTKSVMYSVNSSQYQGDIQLRGITVNPITNENLD